MTLKKSSTKDIFTNEIDSLSNHNRYTVTILYKIWTNPIILNSFVNHHIDVWHWHGYENIYQAKAIFLIKREHFNTQKKSNDPKPVGASSFPQFEGNNTWMQIACTKFGPKFCEIPTKQWKITRSCFCWSEKAVKSYLWAAAMSRLVRAHGVLHIASDCVLIGSQSHGCYLTDLR